MDPASYRGVSDQRLQTRGGERWPDDGSVGDAALPPGGPSRIVLARNAAGQSAPLTAAVRHGQKCADGRLGKSGGEVADPEGGLPETVSPPGAMRNKPTNTARGTPWDLADLRHLKDSTCLDVARRRGPWVLARPLASRAPSVLFRRRIDKETTGLPGASINNTGDDACLFDN